MSAFSLNVQFRVHLPVAFIWESDKRISTALIRLTFSRFIFVFYWFQIVIFYVYQFPLVLYETPSTTT